ncbi:TlpA family protein disulfide reductase [Sabulilitoribacter multivorans]|uniref:TlpA family protein disulfide reductase n=1 Tax=Flaviramulus multivorans TaxID=1304750 RepID=A0ABS9IJA6_9FLAO|nr:TlpA disulfide reductase family protein [Flaviramulus multivorans]MCF7560677.1 TlpA family protein disulfide reductase [Flaviramulus multivorans]
MKKLLILSLAIAIIACKEEPKDYASLSGKITNKNSDSITISTRTYSKTIKVNEDGTFNDTLKVETGVHTFYDGTEATSVFLKNGFDLNITLDTKKFDKSVEFTGIGAEHSDFLAKNRLLQQELLDLDALRNLDMVGLENELNNIESKLSDFYASNSQIDTSITNVLKKNLKPMLGSYKNYLAGSIILKTELPKGSPSPSFEDYENYKGGTTSLSDLKGKYVYVDVWATWCGPCKAEIPSLKKLEKDYHGKNIQFVSLSVDDGRGYRAETKEEAATLAKEGWKAMIKEKELGGIQIIAPEGWQSQFVRDYKINGIPRFLLIDPEGNIVSPDAPRPSSESITKLFTELNI